MNKDIEFRSCDESPVVVDKESRKVSGYAIVFNQRSVDLGGFKEIILPSAVNENTIKSNDVFCLLDHDKKRVLARSKNGVGSLKLTVDERGLKYEFDAPKTQLGDELLEQLDRGDIQGSSFAFIPSKRSVKREEGGELVQYIEGIGRLSDVSPVFTPAYEQTSVNRRSVDEFIEQERALVESAQKVIKEPVQEEVKEDEGPGIKITEPVDATLPIENGTNINNTTNQENTLEMIKPVNNIKKKMNKFSLRNAILTQAYPNEVHALNDFEKEVLNAGFENTRAAGVSAAGNIQIPLTRAAMTVTGEDATGEDAISTLANDFVAALRGKMTLVKAGARFIPGCVGNMNFPVYSGKTAGFVGEIADSIDITGENGSLNLSPKRLSAEVIMSKQFLTQTTPDVEATIREDILNALSEALEATILGDGAKTDLKPAGIFNGKTAAALTYEGLLNLEKEVENQNFDVKHMIVNPAIKAKLKATAVGGTKSDVRMVMNGNEVDGITCESTTCSAGLVLGDFSELIICEWGGLDITVDPYTLASKGQVRVIASMFVDGGLRRPSLAVAKVTV